MAVGPGTYWRTLRHLKLQQLSSRVLRRLVRPRLDTRPGGAQQRHDGPWAAPARRLPSLAPPSRLSFLGVTHDLEECGWDWPGLSKLWRYNQHYFDDLNAFDAGTRRDAHRALIDRWIAANPPAAGTGWEPYPVSLRIVNWIKWALSGAALAPAWQHSLATQARWLRRRIETHLLGNHLLANAKALVFAGLWFDGDEAREWLACGLSILGEQIDEQILRDGGHFERSPMYHALATEDALDLVNLVAACSQAAPPAAFDLATDLRRRLPAMLRWLRAMSHPDGTLALFNDSAQDIAPSTTELERYAGSLGIVPAPLEDGIMALMPSGYIRVERGAAVALLDAAPIGPDYLPGHAHADTLSFELSVGGRRVVVNGGTSVYGTGPQRLRERSTAAHSTVEVAGQNSSEVWSGFRVGRRARPTPAEIDSSGSTWRIACAHDGYVHLSGRPVHLREWLFDEGGLTVVDTVSAPGHRSVARFIVEPALRLERRTGQRWDVIDDRAVIASVEVQCGMADVAGTHYAARFGRVETTTCLEVRLDNGRAVTRWAWQPNAHPVSH